MTKTQRMSAVPLALGGVLLLGALGCSRSEAGTPPEPVPPAGEVWLAQDQALLLKTAPVRSRPVGDSLEVGGWIAFADQQVSHVFSPVNGRVTRLLAQVGQKVKRGAPLAEIVSPDVGTAFSDQVKAQADLDTAQHELRRQEELRAADASSARELELAQDGFTKAKAELARARQRTRLMDATSVNAVTQTFILRAPIDGEVVARNAHPGEEIQGQYAGGSAVELFTVGTLDPLDVYADLREQDLAKAHVGARAEVKVVAYPERSFEGEVEWISSTLDPLLRTAKLRIRLANPEHLLKPEMVATVRLQTEAPAQLALPRAAVVHLGGQTLVYVAKGSAPGGRERFEQRPVVVDEDVSGELCPVSSGLAAGERVVVDGALLLTQAS